MKGYFKPQRPEKYKGDPTNIIYRSSWEKRCMVYFDRNENVIEWESEEFFIPYKSKIDGRIHRYFPDFKIKVKKPDGQIEHILIEVKPYYQTIPPEKKSRVTKRFINEVKTYGINISKWEAAEEFCKDRNWKFMILTEKELGLD